MTHCLPHIVSHSTLLICLFISLFITFTYFSTHILPQSLPPSAPIIRILSQICLTGPLTVSVEDPLPAPPPLAGPSFPSSSTSVFVPPSQDRWPPDRSRSRGSAPNRNARIPPRTDLPLDTQSPFIWRRGGLTECTASCGKGRLFLLFSVI